MNPKLFKIQEQISHIQAKINSSRTSKEKLEAEMEKQNSDIADLKKQLAIVTAEEEKFKKDIKAPEKQKKALQPAELAEYTKKKQEVLAKTSTERKELETLQLQQNVEQSQLESIEAKKAELESRIKQIKEAIDQHNDRKN